MRSQLRASEKGGTYTQSTDQPFSGTTSTPVCLYKGKTYVQGEVWQDGCDYNCTCEEARTGYYRCRGLCPSYTMLPPDCHLVTVPGKCCPNLVCPTVSPGNISINAPDYCKYKGQFYRKGQSWSDGCDATCQCNGNGFYSCGSICLQWQNIPSQCWMETAPPGLCCEQPTCPDSVNVIFNIPMTYKGQYPLSHNIVYVNSKR